MLDLIAAFSTHRPGCNFSKAAKRQRKTAEKLP
jgi:hypothetical protein